MRIQQGGTGEARQQQDREEGPTDDALSEPTNTHTTHTNAAAMSAPIATQIAARISFELEVSSAGASGG